MGNSIRNKNELVFLTSERQTKVLTADGSEILMHKREHFEKGALKRGEYSAQLHNDLTGQHTIKSWTSGTEAPKDCSPTTDCSCPGQENSQAFNQKALRTESEKDRSLTLEKPPATEAPNENSLKTENFKDLFGSPLTDSL